MRIPVATLGALMILSTLVACASPSGRVQGLQELPVGTRWALQASSVEALKSADDTGIVIAFEKGRITGDSGCNQFFADARVVDGRLELGPIGASKRACLGPRMQSERALFDALGKLEGAAMEGGRLRLTTSEGQELVFVDAGKDSE